MDAKSRIALNLTTPERKAMWQAVRDHYSTIFNNSDILLDLVQKKFLEITEGKTKRQVADRNLANTAEILALVKWLAAQHQRRIELEAASPILGDEYTQAKQARCDSVEDAK